MNCVEDLDYSIKYHVLVGKKQCQTFWEIMTLLGQNWKEYDELYGTEQEEKLEVVRVSSRHPSAGWWILGNREGSVIRTLHTNSTPWTLITGSLYIVTEPKAAHSIWGAPWGPHWIPLWASSQY